MEQKDPLAAHNAPHLGKQRPGTDIIEHIHGHVGHDRVETGISEWERCSHIRHEECCSGGGFCCRLLERLARVIQANHGILVLGKPQDIIACAAAKVKEVVCLVEP